LQLSIHAGFLACQKPTMDRNYCLIVFIVCHTVIHRKLQNEYEKKIDVQKKKGGQHLKKKGGRQHRVLTTCTTGACYDFFPLVL
jgi:hypothetical protein